MKSEHKIIFADSRNLQVLDAESIDLVVTSPPYPMIEMWDESFSMLNREIGIALESCKAKMTFELMHLELDKVWSEIFRVLKPGRFVCINIGDATRTVSGEFRLFCNHARILHYLSGLGFSSLPLILWRKQTNAPNKFMGSGMLPAGAYVTLEHEYILILRKGSKRVFKSLEERQNRRQSALFWEERNTWYSDIWDFKGVRQNLDKEIRQRSAAYPFGLAYRLINMYSVKDDTVLDPFLGTGTTTLAAMAAARNSVGVELDTGFNKLLDFESKSILRTLNKIIQTRMNNHLDFAKNNEKFIDKLKYTNKEHCFPVMTRQEVDIKLEYIEKVQQIDQNKYLVTYTDKYYNNEQSLFPEYAL